LHDKFNSKNIIALGLLMCSGSWVLAADADSVPMLYLSYGVLGGLGAGIAFIGVTGLVQKCFSDKRGLATGILMSGYALGPLLTTYAVSTSIDRDGVEDTLRFFGWLFVFIGLVVVTGFRKTVDINIPCSGSRQHVNGESAKQMLKTPAFWLMFLIMTMIAASGMMVTSNIAIIAKEAGIGSGVVMFGLAAVPLALMFDRITNGLSRIVFGSLSDSFGRENTLALAFALEAVFVVAWFQYAHDPLLFIVLSGLVFLAWGEIFSIFPALCTDTFGEKYASVNFGFLYASVGVGAIIGAPLAALLRELTGSWAAVINTVVTLDTLAAILAFTLLRHFVVRHKEHNHRNDLDIPASARATQTTEVAG
jgi:MFS family permease